MVVKILKSMAGQRFSYVRGQEVELPDAKAKSYIKSGVAELVDKVEKAVTKPTGKVEKATATKK